MQPISHWPAKSNNKDLGVPNTLEIPDERNMTEVFEQAVRLNLRVFLSVGDVIVLSYQQVCQAE